MQTYNSDITFLFFLYLLKIHIHERNVDHIEAFDTEKMQFVDMEKLFEFITVHKVDLIVLPILKKINLSNFDIAKLQQRCFQIARRQLLMEKQFVELLEVLDKNNIDNIILKGLPLDKKLYGNCSKRVYKDIDILIKPEQLYETHGLLLELGFILTVEGERTFSFIKKHPYAKNIIKDFEYINRKTGVVLELHWKVTGVGDFKTNLFEEGIEKFKYKSVTSNVLKDEYNLSYLLIHGYRSGWHRLKWVVDIIDFTKTQKIDQNLFKQILLKDLKEYKSTLDFNSILKELFDFESDILKVSPPNIIQKIANNYRVKHIKRTIYLPKEIHDKFKLNSLAFRKLVYQLLVYPSKIDYLKVSFINFLFKKEKTKLLKEGSVKK